MTAGPWAKIDVMTLYDDGLPDRLWHYTSGSAAQSILTSNTLWAGHLGFMNDTSEVNHAMSLSLQVIHELRAQLPEHAGAFDQWHTYVTDSPPKSWAPNVFAVSFSEKRDLLSQWRGYATGPGGPFCIGFSSELFTARIDASEGEVWTLRKCIYSRDEQLALLEERIRHGLDLTDQFGGTERFPSRDDLGYSHIFGAVMNAAPLLKHPDFAEENEWRLVFGPVDLRNVGTVHFVQRAHTLAPYIEYRLTDEGEPLDDIHWVAGPGPQQDRANTALGMIARIAGITRYQGAPSHTPYLT